MSDEEKTKKEKDLERELAAQLLKKKYEKILTVENLEAELKRETYKHNYSSTLMGTVYSLVVVAAIAVLVATLWMPVLQVYGRSMNPTLVKGDIVISVRGTEFEPGEIVAFYYGNKLLVKRYIAGAGDWVNIDQDGNVYVNDVLLDEPYLKDGQKAFGDCNIDLPYQVPDNRYFVLGDNRDVSIDSRNTAVGNVTEEQMVGSITFRVWPLTAFGRIK